MVLFYYSFCFNFRFEVLYLSFSCKNFISWEYFINFYLRHIHLCYNWFWSIVIDLQLKTTYFSISCQIVSFKNVSFFSFKIWSICISQSNSEPYKLCKFLLIAFSNSLLFIPTIPADSINLLYYVFLVQKSVIPGSISKFVSLFCISSLSNSDSLSFTIWFVILIDNDTFGM